MQFNSGIAISMESKSFPNEIPIPIHVVFVDFDHTSLVLQDMLNSCGYQVTKFDNAEEALVLLRKDKHKITIVITSDHLNGNISGFEMLNIVSSEIQLPIIMVSSDDRVETKVKANLLGCCEYIVRPTQIDSLKNIWEHVIRHKKKLQDFEKNLQARLENINSYNNNNNQDDGSDIPKGVAIIENNLGGLVGEGVEEDGKGLIKKRGIENISVFEEHLSNMSNVAKKPRLVWSPNLHEDFVTAINQIGYHNAVPKKILEIMKNMGYKNLSRENIASHLQKYRDYVDKEKNKQLQKAKDDRICSTSEIQNISPNIGLKDEMNHFETQELRMNNDGDPTWSTTIVMQPNVNNVIEAQISPWGVNNQYSIENGINNNNNPAVNELVKLEPQHLMSYQIDGNNCFDNLSYWQNLSTNNLSTDRGLTLDEEFENIEQLFISNVAHETSVQPHQDFGLI